jgi:hypothetical protein
MGLWQWCSAVFTDAGKILARYKRGMRRANAHDYNGAIDDYDAVIASPNSGSALRCMARFNRAVAHVALGQITIAVQELTSVVAESETPVNVRTAARQKLIRINRPATGTRH